MDSRQSTTAIGNMYEQHVYSYICDLFENGGFGYTPKSYQIFQKKIYKSKITQEEIEIDISIELYYPDSNDISTLLVFECKNYQSRVGNEKIKKFHADMVGIGASRGYFFTSHGFQGGSVKYAKAYNIALAILPENNIKIKWVTRRVGCYVFPVQCFEKENNQDEHNHFVALGQHNVYYNLRDFLIEDVLHKELTYNVPFIEDSTIEQKALKCEQSIQRKNSILESDELVSIVTAWGFEFQSVNLDDNLLGICNFELKQIQVSSTLSFGSARWRFTLAHEIGHLVLHQEYAEENSFQSIIDDDNYVNAINNKDIARMEAQANQFASYLLMPMQAFIAKYGEIHKKYAIPKFPYLYLDNQACNIRDCHNVFNDLALHFKTSKQSIQVRLQKMNLLTIDKKYSGQIIC